MYEEQILGKAFVDLGGFLKNIILKKNYLIIKEYKKGTFVIVFSLIGFALLFFSSIKFPGYFFMLLLVTFSCGLVSFMSNFHLKYLEINKNILYIYPTGEYSHRYEIPMERVSSISTINKRIGLRRQNIKINFNQEYSPVLFIYRSSYKTVVKTNEIEFYSFPISKKNLPLFVNLLKKSFGIDFIKKTN